MFFWKRKISKEQSELNFWKSELDCYIEWYLGKRELYGFPSPLGSQRRARGQDIRKKAAIIWNELFQKKKYLTDLQLSSLSFVSKRLLDIGCGPNPSALCFVKCQIYGVDHLLNDYRLLGYPLDDYPKRYHFISAKAETMPFLDGYFDAVISVNAIDHVDNLEKTAKEIRRVLRPGGMFRMHVHYHQPTLNEPIAISDRVFRRNFYWLGDLKKIKETRYKDMGMTRAKPGESFVVWSNF